MNKFLTATISFFLLFVLTIPVGAQFDLPKAGFTPDSPLYFLDQWGESIGMLFSFSSESKANKALRYSEEKLAELKSMADNNSFKNTERVTQKYQQYLNLAQRKTERIQKQQQKRFQLEEKVAQATSKHLSVLEEVMGKVPEQAKSAIQEASQNSKQGHLNALKALSKDRPQRAVEISSESLQQRLQQAEQAAERNQSRQFEVVLNNFQELQGEIEQIPLKQTELMSLASKSKIAQMKALEKVEEASKKMSEEQRQKLDEVKNKLQVSFQKSLTDIATRSPKQAANLHLEALGSKLQEVQKESTQLRQRTQQCDGECKQVCQNKSNCVAKCVELVNCNSEDEQCLRRANQKCESACQSKAECESNCSEACLQQQQKEMKQEASEFQKQSKFGKNISVMAQQLGKDQMKVEELVSKATSHHLDVLNEVYQKVPEQAKSVIQEAIQISTQGRERAIKALQKKAGEGSTEASEALERIRQVQPKFGPDQQPEEEKPGSPETPVSPKEEQSSQEQSDQESGGSPGVNQPQQPGGMQP